MRLSCVLEIGEGREDRTWRRTGVSQRRRTVAAVKATVFMRKWYEEKKLRTGWSLRYGDGTVEGLGRAQRKEHSRIGVPCRTPVAEVLLVVT